jgi:Kef-type K+ transport system membrane component KefB
MVALACGTAPALAIDLFVVPTPPVELGGFLQFAYGVATAFFAVLGLVGAMIGAAAAKAEQVDLVQSERRRIALGVAVFAALAGWVWIAATVATAST